MNYKEKYQDFQDKIANLEERLHDFNQQHAKKIAENIDEILDIDGVQGCRILESGSPECRMRSEIRVYVKLSEEAQEPNDIYFHNDEEHFNFYESSISTKIEEIIGEEYQDTLGVQISDSWDLSEPSYWQELVAEKIIEQE